ncbi:UDP-glucuronosyltransferase 1-1 [Homalodisca vitripennis]|nr:UDP-glucuronosyltransferase 1-1 [Homalodisca vitripennis]
MALGFWLALKELLTRSQDSFSFRRSVVQALLQKFGRAPKATGPTRALKRASNPLRSDHGGYLIVTGQSRRSPLLLDQGGTEEGEDNIPPLPPYGHGSAATLHVVECWNTVELSNKRVERCPVLPTVLFLAVHPKMRLFITHCGVLSTQEAIYRKVPILGLPVFCDQMDNAHLLVRHNLTIQMNPRTITSEQLLEGIKEILSNPMYKKNMERMGDLMTDMPLTSKQQAVFWSEYAIRHQGAPHLRSAAADMSWIQLLMFDVIGTAFLILLVILWVTKGLLSLIMKKIGLYKPKNKKD